MLLAVFIIFAKNCMQKKNRMKAMGTEEDALAFDFSVLIVGPRLYCALI